MKYKCVFVNVMNTLPRFFNGALRSVFTRDRLIKEYLHRESNLLVLSNFSNFDFEAYRKEGFFRKDMPIYDWEKNEKEFLNYLKLLPNHYTVIFIVEWGYAYFVRTALEKIKSTIENPVKVMVMQDIWQNYQHISYENYKHIDAMVFLSDEIINDKSVLTKFVPMAKYMNKVSVPHMIYEYCSYSSRDEREPYSLCMIGSLGERKNQVELIKQIYFIKEYIPNVILNIYGHDESGGKYTRMMYSYIENLNLHENVKIHEPCKNPLEVIKKQMLCVSASNVEGLPFHMIEALTAGTPIVSFDKCFGPKTLIKDGYTGYICKTSNDFVNGVKKLLLSPTTWNKFSMNSYKTAREKFSGVAVSNIWKNILEDIL